MGDRLAARHLALGTLDINMNPLMVAGRIGEFVDDRLIDRKPIADPDFLADILSEVCRPFEFNHPLSLLALLPMVYPIHGGIGKARNSDFPVELRISSIFPMERRLSATAPYQARQPLHAADQPLRGRKRNPCARRVP
jgi:hypothetical protein